MNRWLFAANVALAAVLLFLVAQNGRIVMALASPISPPLTARDLRVVRVDADRQVIDFGSPMMPDDAAIGATADLGLRLEPHVPVSTLWRTPSQCLVVAQKPLRKATRYTVHFARVLEARDGRATQRGLALTLATETIDVRDVVVSGDDARAEPVVLLCLTMPAAASDVKERLRIRATDGRELRASVLELDSEGGQVHEIRVPDALGLDALDLTLDGSLTPRGGDVPMGRAFERRIVLNEPVELRHATAAADHVELGFNRVIGLPEAGTIRLDPPVPFQIQVGQRGLRLCGAFAPGSTLAIELAEGFPGHGRTALRRAVRRSLLVPDLDPSLAIEPDGRVLSALARPELRVHVVQVARPRLEVRRAYDNNVLRLAQDRLLPDEAFAPPVVVELAGSPTPNVEATARVDLAELLGRQPLGVYRVRVADPELRARPIERMLQVTDLGLTVRAAIDAVAVQVTSLARGGPVAGAALEVRTPTDQVLVTGTTGADGTAVLRFAPTGADRRPFLVHATHGDDQVFVDLADYVIELDDAALGGLPYVDGRAEAMVAPSRGIVRPGERCDATIAVREGTGRAPVGMPLTVVWHAPGGRVAARRSHAVPAAGLLALSHELGVDAPTGSWRIEVLDAERDARIGVAAFLCEAFVPDRLEAEVDAGPALRLGETGEVRVRARWLDGAPASGRPVELAVRFDGFAFRPEGLAAFSFGPAGDDSRRRAPPGAQPRVRGTLDERGEAVLRFAVPAADPALGQALLARLDVEVEDPSGRAVRATALVPALREDVHLGVRADRGSVEVVLVDASGQPCGAGTMVTVELEQRTWTQERVAARAGRWRYESRIARAPLARQEVRVGSDGRASVALAAPAEHAGWIVVVARALDGAVLAEQIAGASPLAPDRLRVSTAGPVAAGSTARLAVDSPAAGRGFVTLEGRGIHGCSVVDLAAGHNDVDVAIPAGLELPNIHAVVTLTRAQAGADDVGPFWSCSGTAIPLARDELATEVAIHSPAEVLPESTVELTVVAPRANAATIALVDEGVLRLTGYRAPDPLALFRAQRRLDGTGADTGAFLVQDVRFDPAVKTGGDGNGIAAAALAGSVTTSIRPVALFAGPVPLDAAGRATVKFALPDYEGRLRAVVIASGERASGAASHAITVRAPLGLRIATPRMLMPGDRSTAPITIANHTGAAGEVELTVAATGGLELFEPAPARLALAAGEVRTVELPFRADEPSGGRPAIAVTAKLGALERRIEAGVTVRTPTAFAQQFTGLRFNGAPQELTIPDDWSADGLAVRLRADTTPEVELRPAVESLVAYPYGCLEQTTSRAMALLACRALLPRLYEDEPQRTPDVAPLLQAAVDRLFAMQIRDGSFGLWPNARDSYAFGTVHAVDFLLDAAATGVDVPEAALARAVDALAGLVERSADLSLRCHAAEVLARAGRPVRSRLDWLAGEAVRGDDRARLTLAFARLGDRRRAAELCAHGETADDDAAREQGGMLRSPLRTTALRLRALLAATPGVPRLVELAQELRRALLEPSRWTTQELAHAVRALADYHGVAPGRNDAPLELGIASGRRSWVIRRGGTVTLDGIGPGDRITITPRTAARAFGWLSVSGQRRAGTATSGHGITIERRILDIDTGEPVASFRRGRTYEVRLTISLDRAVENLLVTDLLAGGFELEIPSLGRAPPTPPDVAVPSHVERRDDRVLLFDTARRSGRVELAYHVRAVFPGTYRLPHIVAEAMYEPSIGFRGAGDGTVEIGG
jgi:hypothetical protein